MGLLKLFVHRANGTLVRSDQRPEGYTIPPLVQGDTVSIEFSLVEDNPEAGVGKVSLVNLASYSLKIGVGATPLGDGSVTPFALQTSFTLDTAQTKLTGYLGLNTTELTTWLGANASKSAWFEVEIRDTSTGNYETVYGGSVTIRASLVTAGSSVSIPGDTALGSSEAAATYVRKIGGPGESIKLVSSDGSRALIVYCGNDGTLHADPA